MENDSSTGIPPTPDITDSQWDSIEENDDIEYTPETDTYRASFDSATDSVSMAVVSTVAAVAETNPQELPPLYSVIETDALEALIESNVTGPSSSDIHVSFTFADHDVTVHDYGIIAVQPPEEG